MRVRGAGHEISEIEGRGKALDRPGPARPRLRSGPGAAHPRARPAGVLRARRLAIAAREHAASYSQGRDISSAQPWRRPESPENWHHLAVAVFALGD